MVFMLQHTKNSFLTKTLVISVVTVSLVACANTETATTPTDAANPSSTSVATSSPQTTNSPTSINIPGVNNVKEINFKAPSSASGFFNGISDSRQGPIMEVQQASNFNISGWAILATEGKPADRVIITYGDTNSVIAVVPVNSPRPDVTKELKNPAYNNSGWSTTLNASILPSDQVILKGWAYNSASKEAIGFNNSLKVNVLK